MASRPPFVQAGVAAFALVAGCVAGHTEPQDGGVSPADATGLFEGGTADGGSDAPPGLPALLFTSYPTTWTLAGGHYASDYIYSSDVNVQVDGQLTARFEQNPSSFGAGVDDAGVTPDAAWAPAAGFTMPVTSYIGMRVRMRAKVRTENVTVGTGLWFRIDSGMTPVALCNMIDGGIRRQLTGTHDFIQLDCVLDVPPNATAFVFGALLNGSGTAWFGVTTFEQVGLDVPESPRAL